MYVAIKEWLTRGARRTIVYLCLGATAGIALLGNPAAFAEYGDVVMNRNCDSNGIAPVVFPHWFHRIRYRCKVCHGDLGIAAKAGGNDVSMLSIIDGQQCGACHNGDIAWSSERCDLCHSGKRGLATQTYKGSAVKSAVSAPVRSGK